MLECANTGRLYTDPGDGICDEGEWISWDWINEQIEAQEAAAKATPTHRAKPLSPVLARLIADAKAYHARHGKVSRILGELGERYIEEQFGMVRHKRCAQGSDGKIGDQFVEVKTITPGKKKQQICVKRAGHFGLLAVVRIDQNYNFEARLIDRRHIQKGSGRLARLSWKTVVANGRVICHFFQA